MSFEYLTEQNKILKLSEQEQDSLVAQISSEFNQYNSDRQYLLDKSELLEQEIFMVDKNEDSSSQTDDWKSKIKMGKPYMFYQTLKAFIWKNVYSNVNSMFDVAGENYEADNDSNKQKAALVDVFEKMSYQKTCDKIIDYALIYGELITFCAWKKKTQEYRKQISKDDLLNPKAISAMASGKFHFIDEKVIYDNPYIYPVNPVNFVFDVSQKDNWDDCPKIYKTFKNPDDIINNKYYDITPEIADELRNMVGGKSYSGFQSDNDLKSEKINGGTVEVLEHWGNLRLKNGTLLKNWHAVVVAGKYLVRFKKNNRIVNPFTYASFVEDPISKRGISPLYSIISLSNLQEELMNRTLNMQSLSENPPIYSPKGFFDDDCVKLYPGKIIEFGDELNPSEIQQMTFNSNIFLNDISFISDLMAEVSGVFPNMAGADETKSKTATEITTKTQGQLTRLAMLIDIINQDLVVEDVKKVAKLLADFKQGDEDIFVINGNEKKLIRINDKIRKADYRYTYSDRSATVERSNKADLVAQAVERFAKFIPLNVPEIFTWYMEQKDVENPERFLQQANVETKFAVQDDRKIGS